MVHSWPRIVNRYLNFGSVIGLHAVLGVSVYVLIGALDPWLVQDRWLDQTQISKTDMGGFIAPPAVAETEGDAVSEDCPPDDIFCVDDTSSEPSDPEPNTSPPSQLSPGGIDEFLVSQAKETVRLQSGKVVGAVGIGLNLIWLTLAQMLRPDRPGKVRRYQISWLILLLVGVISAAGWTLLTIQGEPIFSRNGRDELAFCAGGLFVLCFTVFGPLLTTRWIMLPAVPFSGLIGELRLRIGF